MFFDWAKYYERTVLNMRISYFNNIQGFTSLIVVLSRGSASCKPSSTDNIHCCGVFLADIWLTKAGDLCITHKKAYATSYSVVMHSNSWTIC